METFKLKKGILSNFRKMFLFSLSLFFLLGLAGCSDSKSDSGDIPTWRIYANEGGSPLYILTLTEEASGYSYRLQKDGVVISQGTAVDNGGTFTFTSDGTSDAGGSSQTTGNVQFNGVAFGNFTLNLDSSVTEAIPSLQLIDGRLFYTGYTAATDDAAAFIYFRLPQQYKLSTEGLPSGVMPIDSIEYLCGSLSYVSLTNPQNSGYTLRGYNIGEHWLTQAFVNSHTPKPAGAISGDARELYSYFTLAASDGFSWRRQRRGEVADLSWTGELQKAYIATLETDGVARTMFDIPHDYSTASLSGFVNMINGNSRSAPGSSKFNYRNVSFVEHIFGLRTINVQLGDTLEVSRSNLIRIQTGATPERSFLQANSGVLTKGTPGYQHITEAPIGTYARAIKVDTHFLTAYVLEGNTGASLTARGVTIIGLNNPTGIAYDATDVANAYFIPAQEFIAVYSGGSWSKHVYYPVTIKVGGATFYPPGVTDGTGVGEKNSDASYTASTNKPPALATTYR